MRILITGAKGFVGRNLCETLRNILDGKDKTHPELSVSAIYETGRFINADNIAYLDPKTINGCNLYAYCLNNPIMYYDPSGCAVISFIVSIASYIK